MCLWLFAFGHFIGKGLVACAAAVLSLYLTIPVALTLVLFGGSLLIMKEIVTFLAAFFLGAANYVAPAGSRAVKTVPTPIWRAFEFLVSIAVLSVLVLAKLGTALAAWVVILAAWILNTFADASHLTILPLIISILDPSFALHASAMVMIQIFESSLIPFLTAISVLTAHAALITLLNAAIAIVACGSAAILMIATGTWIALATILAAISLCAASALGSWAGLKSKLESEVELYTSSYNINNWCLSF